jgi:hypothetical protein
MVWLVWSAPVVAQTTVFRFPKVVFTSTDADTVKSYGAVTLITSGAEGADGVNLYFANPCCPTTYRHKIRSSVASDTSLGYLTFSLATGESTFVDVLTLRETGRVGIGTTTPDEVFQIIKNATPAKHAFGMSILSAANDSLIALGASADGDYGYVQTAEDNGATWLTRPLALQPMGGKVGINKTDPQEKLQILADSVPNEGTMGFSVLSSAGDSEIALGVSASGDYGWVQAFQDATSWTTRPLVLQPSGGYVGIGTTAATTTHALEVVGSIGVSNGSTSPGSVTLFEDSDNGTETVQIIAPAAVTSARVLTLPNATGTIALTDQPVVVTTIDSASVTTQRVDVTTLTDATATTVLTIAMADAARTGGELAFTIEATDASADNDVYTGAIRFTAQRKGAAATCAVGPIGTAVVTKSHAGADLTVAATCDASSGTAIVLKLNADTALTATTFKAHWHLTMLKGHGAIS